MDIELIASPPKGIPKLLKESWKEIVPTFETIEAEIKKIPIEKLKSVGLSGSQLRLKHAIYTHCREELFEILAKFKVNILRTLPVRLLLKIRSLYKKILKSIDIILDSLSAVVPQTHIIKEIKDAISFIISWQRD